MKVTELDPRIRIRAALRCDGIGRLDCAEDTVSGERVAVRWLPLDANGDAAVKACEKLPAHPTLPRIRQTGQVGTSAFVALDFPDGELLSARGEERLENEQLLRLAAQLSDALSTVHAQNVVHGEMSRDSVLMVNDGRAYLWDMPLVIANRLSDRRGENRLMQNLVKSAAYLAPERARGEGASQAADVYSLGAILCVSGGAPLPSAATTLGVVHQVASGEWVPRVPSTLPEQWRAMLERMVSREASRRPTAADVALCFAKVPAQNMLPTVPEMPAVRLPPEILQAAEALMKSQVEAMRAPTREVPVQSAASVVSMPVAGLRLEVPPAAVEAKVEEAKPVEAKADESKPEETKSEKLEEAKPVEARSEQAEEVKAAPLPLAADPMPELKLNAEAPVNAHTLDSAEPESQPDVVRIPTTEIKAIAAELPAVANTQLPKHLVPTLEIPRVQVSVKSVPLQENVSVSPELAAAGAVALSEEEIAAIHASNRKVWIMFGSIAAAALALVAAAVVLATRQNEVVVVPVAAPVVAPKKVAPKPALDELVPLPKLAPVKAAPVRKAVAPAPVAVPVVVAAEPAEAAPAQAKQPEPTKPEDFNFLDVAEAPKSELKRPSTEL
ncbi:MAG: protein kinase [Archangium sp.]|nr:protein kinase [Archangium sp.]